ncbi:MAG: hypothetical protein EBY80_14425 [Actinobacteria bacterium]|nr:hypothetical protein [Actinomycetota bacterium]
MDVKDVKEKNMLIVGIVMDRVILLVMSVMDMEKLTWKMDQQLGVMYVKGMVEWIVTLVMVMEEFFVLSVNKIKSSGLLLDRSLR